MLSLSQSTGYAVLALSGLRERQGGLMLAREVAACTGIPLPYLQKLLHVLAKSRLIVAKRGYRGGFALARPAEEICLLDIAEAVEGRAWLPRCLLGLEECSDARACPTHAFWTKERARIEAELRRTSLREVAAFEARRTGRLGTCDEGCQAERSKRGKRRGTKRSGRGNQVRQPTGGRS